MWLRKVFQQRAMWGFFVLFALWFGYVTAHYLVVGLGIVGAVISLLLAFLCFAKVETGVYILTAYALFNSGLAVLLTGGHFQAGIPLDIVLLITFAGLLVQKTRVQEAGREFFGTPIVVMWMVLFGYLILQGANPLPISRAGWLQQLRKSLEEIGLLFICYCAFDTPQRIRQFLKVLFVLCVLVGFYGCIQQWHGLFPFELNWVNADKTRFGLLFVMGDFRKFSTLADPTTFGIVMAAMVALYIIVAMHQRAKWKRWLLIVGCVVMMLGMFYSGTRTANVILLVGLFMYMLLNADKRVTWIFGLTMAGLLLVALNLPIYSSSTLNRFRTSFQGAKDASYNVRELSRHFIQPYIHSHPFGGGIGTTNDYGKLTNPGHYLAGFQTDDGYLKFALEIGWIGLLMICVWNFIILRTGIHGFFRARSQEARWLYIATLAGLVPFMVALLAQDVIGQMSNDAIIFPLMALMMRLPVFDRQEAS
ncbi:MAG TPA: O-antigen ligase family protein [Puia sp.]|uniref:O-antigen ligase family protein n=1 Tax=Puia sp. TaxID=2045100 RepID=UPI002CDDD2FA|nr:O-antigen ligase family protein [Puia sp.]HVU95087.1 O-antigen ligase family protein [Puia sp.]